MIKINSIYILVLLCEVVVTSCFAVSAPTPIKLTYFDIEGVAECVRLALLLSNTPFEDERVEFKDWQTLKPTTPYGQLPLMTIGDDALQQPRTQSKAMLRYVGATYSSTLYPKEKLLDIEEAIGVIDDFQLAQRMIMVTQKVGFPEGFYETQEGKEVIQTIREKFLNESIPKYVQYMIAMVNKNNGKWLASIDEPTIADCLAVPLLRSLTRGRLDHIPASCLDTYPEIVDYIHRFCSLAPIEGRYSEGLH